jgi:hypothetical protein
MSAHHRFADFFEQGLLVPVVVIADVSFWTFQPKASRRRWARS